MVTIRVKAAAASSAPGEQTGDGDTIDQCDLLLFAVGYEHRSRHVAQQWSGRYKRAIGVRFGHNEIFAFEENLAWAASRNAMSVALAESAIGVGQLIYNSFEPSDGFKVVIDVSSFPRTYLAEIVLALWRLSSDHNIEVCTQFAYSVPEFSEPAQEHGPVVSLGAVQPEFAGVSDAGWGLAALIGLGYEPDLALSAQQVLDPAVTWLAVPRSADGHFDKEVAKANEVLLDVVETANVYSYNVSDPATTFYSLESIVNGLRRIHNVVLVPFGPKMFAICCLLVSLSNSKEVGVWRLSAGSFREPRDQYAAGPIHYLYARFCGAESQ